MPTIRSVRHHGENVDHGREKSIVYPVKYEPLSKIHGEFILRRRTGIGPLISEVVSPCVCGARRASK